MAGANLDTVAKALNLTPRRVNQLVGEGLPRAARGEYDLGQCMAWYIRYLQRALERRSAAFENEDVAEFTRERARLAREQADRTALQNAEARGDLGRLSVWADELERFLSHLRAALLALPAKCAPLAHGDTAQRERIITEEVYEVLGKLAGYRPTRGTPGGSARHSVGRRRAAAATATNGQRVGRPLPEPVERE